MYDSSAVNNPVKIKLIGGKPIVWRASDWKTLQLNRIHGSEIGSVPGVSKQASVNGLPVSLLKEEVTLILEKKLGNIFKYKPQWKEIPTEKTVKAFKEYRKRNSEEQMDCFLKENERQIVSRIDSIREGKRKKLIRQKKTEKGGKDLTEEELEVIETTIDKENIFSAELVKKKQSIEKNNPTLIQIPTVDPWMSDEDITVAEWNYPETEKEKLQYKIFKDLWERDNYSITPGTKFGGDYLVYPGHPWKFHALFIVICVPLDEPIPLRDIISKTRISVFSRKHFVLASVDKEDKVVYQTISWPEKKFKRTIF